MSGTIFIYYVLSCLDMKVCFQVCFQQLKISWKTFAQNFQNYFLAYFDFRDFLALQRCIRTARTSELKDRIMSAVTDGGKFLRKSVLLSLDANKQKKTSLQWLYHWLMWIMAMALQKSRNLYCCCTCVDVIMISIFNTWQLKKNSSKTKTYVSIFFQYNYGSEY